MSLKVKPFCIELGYFMTLLFIGFLALNYVSKPSLIDVFFTSISSAIVSSMSTIEMVVFSNVQLIFMIILTFLGGEAFTSFLRLKLIKKETKDNSFSSKDYELGNVINVDDKLEDVIINPIEDSHDHDKIIKMKSIRLLSYVVIGYILVVIFIGSLLVSPK